jgi:hypothetical protein
MHLVRAAAAVGSAVVLFGATAAAVELTGDDSARPSATALGASPEVQRYWSDTKRALSPLLLYVRILPETVAAVERSNGRLKPGQIQLAGDMAESFATARDLVGRLPVPASVTGDVGELLQLACQLYREAALSLREMVPARAESLRVIGDRLIDQSRRVLAIDAAQPDAASVELQYAPPVPALADIAAGSSTAELDSAAAALAATGAGQGEDVIGARLSILLGVLADQAGQDGRVRSARALRTLSADLWNTARTLAVRPHPVLAGPALPLPHRAQVWTGGAFDGHPPALRPGDDVDAGLPGGLPSVDPAQILRG